MELSWRFFQQLKIELTISLCYTTPWFLLQELKVNMPQRPLHTQVTVHYSQSQETEAASLSTNKRIAGEK